MVCTICIQFAAVVVSIRDGHVNEEVRFSRGVNYHSNSNKNIFAVWSIICSALTKFASPGDKTSHRLLLCCWATLPPSAGCLTLKCLCVEVVTSWFASFTWQSVHFTSYSPVFFQTELFAAAIFAVFPFASNFWHCAVAILSTVLMKLMKYQQTVCFALYDRIVVTKTEYIKAWPIPS